ncbi:MAG TPA: glycosyltransferase, partial [Deltaproteobacteria bacterium]|nr:glycosyltransferase [Deltaproteobacteria bacterium]
GGTLEELRRIHPVLPPAVVIHNGAVGGIEPEPPGRGIGCVGSIRPYKDPRTVARAARRTLEPVIWIGPGAREIEALQELAGGRLGWEPPLASGRIPQRLARFRALLLPLSAGLFGERLTSPLKLWDALASGIPLVAADTPAVREAAGAGFVPYPPGDADALVAALDAACRDEALRTRVLDAAGGRVRRWSDRAAEIETFADRVIR